MKKIAFIGIITSTLLVACSKVDVSPRSKAVATPEWAASAMIISDSGNGVGTSGNEGGGITDPNNDEDANGKKKN